MTQEEIKEREEARERALKALWIKDLEDGEEKEMLIEEYVEVVVNGTFEEYIELDGFRSAEIIQKLEEKDPEAYIIQTQDSILAMMGSILYNDDYSSDYKRRIVTEMLTFADSTSSIKEDIPFLRELGTSEEEIQDMLKRREEKEKEGKKEKKEDPILIKAFKIIDEEEARLKKEREE